MRGRGSCMGRGSDGLATGLGQLSRPGPITNQIKVGFAPHMQELPSVGGGGGIPAAQGSYIGIINGHTNIQGEKGETGNSDRQQFTLAEVMKCRKDIKVQVIGDPGAWASIRMGRQKWSQDDVMQCAQCFIDTMPDAMLLRVQRGMP